MVASVVRNWFACLMLTGIKLLTKRIRVQVVSIMEHK